MDKEREENSVKAGQTMQEIQLNMDIKEQGAGKMPRKEWMKMQIESRSENEEFARVTVAVFMSRMDPTLEEINDVKTAVSEAVTNCVIHGYGNGEGIIYIEVLRKMSFPYGSGTKGKELKISGLRWSPCIPAIPPGSVPVWDSLLWRRSWIRWRWNRNLAKGQRLS
mgnify:CR=1 FL=1